VEGLLALEEEISKIQLLDIEPQTELVGEEIRTIEKNIDIDSLVFVYIGVTTLW
jgi:hypothetical protein